MQAKLDTFSTYYMYHISYAQSNGNLSDTAA